MKIIKNIFIVLAAVAIQIAVFIQVLKAAIDVGFAGTSADYKPYVLLFFGFLVLEAFIFLCAKKLMEKGTTRAVCMALCVLPSFFIALGLLSSLGDLNREYAFERETIAHTQTADAAAKIKYQEMASSDLEVTITGVSTDGGNYSGYLQTDSGFLILPPQLQPTPSGESPMKAKNWYGYGAAVWSKFGAFEARTLPGEKVKIVLPPYVSYKYPVFYDGANWILYADFYLPNGQLFSQANF